MTDDAGERLKQIRLRKGYPNAGAAAKAFGWDPVTYRAHERGRGLTVKAAQKYARAYGVPLSAIFVGSEPEGVEPDERTIVSFDELEGPPPEDEREPGVAEGEIYAGSRPGAMPEIDANPGAGIGREGRVVTLETEGIQSGHVVVGEWILPAGLVRHWIGTDPRRTLVMKVVGDSMSPTIQSGDRVMVDMTDTNPANDAIYVLDDGHGPIVKRVSIVRGSDPVRLFVKSDNPLAQSFEIAADRARIIGRVCARTTPM